MEATILSAFLEELVYQSDVKCHINDLFERLEDRGLPCDNTIKTCIWPTIRLHPDVYFVTPESIFNKWSFIDEDHVPHQWIVPSPNDSSLSYSWPFDAFWLLASPTLRKSKLNLWQHPEIADIPIRMRILSGIASKRYEGCWQCELIRDLNIDAKSMFQHLKAFFKYDLVIRFNLPLPHRLKRFGNTSSSSVLWLPQFFDTRQIPKDILQMISTQQFVPLENRVVELLKTVPNNIILETDARSFCLSFIVQPGQSPLTCSMKTAARSYQRIRRDLIMNKHVVRVKAWCPQSAKFESSLALYEAKCIQQSKLLGAPKREMQLNHCNSKLRRQPSIYQSDDSGEDREHDTGEELAEVKVEVTPINPDDFIRSDEAHELSMNENEIHSGKTQKKK